MMLSARQLALGKIFSYRFEKPVPVFGLNPRRFKPKSRSYIPYEGSITASPQVMPCAGFRNFPDPPVPS